MAREQQSMDGEGGFFHKLKTRLAWKLVSLMLVGFAALWGCVFVLLKASSQKIIEQQALALAEHVGTRVRAMRARYTNNVVKKLQSDLPGQVKGSVEFNKPGEIPLPAVFVRVVNETAEELTRQNNEVPTVASLVSEWNINEEKGVATSDKDFDREGWNKLLDQQEAIRKQARSTEDYVKGLKEHRWKAYSKVERIGDKDYLRYFTADPASDQACVNCHNGLEQRPDVVARRKKQGLSGKVFVLNELMGALSVRVPLEKSGAVAAAQSKKFLIVFTGALGVILLGLAAFLSAATRRIRALTSITSRIVAEGDLTYRVEVTSQDEVGQLAMSFERMVAGLREVIKNSQDAADMLNQSTGSLTDSAQTLGNAVQKLSAASSEQGQTVTRQAASLQETQVTAQEIKQTSLMASQKAEDVLRVTERADEVSRQGSEALERSIAGLNDLRIQSEDIARKITDLTERTRRIGGITDTVKGLADQSNMLALNAAIEAVRSGEHGKGFAVVAREIRNLADQSIQATTQVQEILSDIGGAIDQAVSITQRGAQKMESGLSQVRQSGTNLRELSEIVKENSSAVRQIAAAVSQQNAGIGQIFGAVNDQTKMMDETVKRLSSSQQAAQVVGQVSTKMIDVSRRMNDISRTVSDIVRRYRV